MFDRLLDKSVRIWILFCGNVFTYKFSFFNSYSDYQFLLELALVAFVFQGICPFYLSFRIYWYTVVIILIHTESVMPFLSVLILVSVSYFLTISYRFIHFADFLKESTFGFTGSLYFCLFH